MESISKVKELYLKDANISMFDKICEESDLRYIIEFTSYKKICEFLLEKSEGLGEIQAIIKKFSDKLYCL